jgi:hypothetical protein
MCVFEEGWKEMDQTHLHAYFWVLILTGVFRSNGESTESLWEAETGRTFLCNNVSGKLPHYFQDYPLQ